MKYILYILLLIAIFSCERELELDSGSYEKRPVVNAILSSDSLIVVNLTYSSYFTESTYETIERASVQITDLTEGESYQLYHSGGGNFQNRVAAISSHDYRLEIENVGSKLISAETCVPNDVELNLTIDTLYDELNLISELEIDIEIKNDPDTDNYYSLEVFEYSKVKDSELETDSVTTVNLIEPLQSQLLHTTNDLGLKTLNIFTDIGFDGKDVKTSFNIGRSEILFDNGTRGGSSNGSSNGNEETDETEGEARPKYAIRIMAMSPELYNYLKSFEIYSQQENLVTSNTQPSSIDFNIINGLGIFGGSNVQIIPIN